MNSAIPTLLAARYLGAADSTNTTASSILQQHRGGVRHMGMAVDCTPETNDNQVFIVTLRHPVDRLISWYKYEHLRNGRIQQNPKVKRRKSCLNQFHKYQDNMGCFSSLEEFAINTLQASNDTCQQLAYNVASGSTPCMWHNQMGYRYYRGLIEQVTATCIQRHRQTSCAGDAC